MMMISCKKSYFIVLGNGLWVLISYVSVDIKFNPKSSINLQKKNSLKKIISYSFLNLCHQEMKDFSKMTRNEKLPSFI
jgi:hypothetical protein